MTDQLDELLAGVPAEPVTSVTTAPPRRHRHDYVRSTTIGGDQWICLCGQPQDPAASRRGRSNRKRGSRHELAIARRYGGRKVGELKLPWDIEGAIYATQVKTHAGWSPSWWRTPGFLAFGHDLPTVGVHDANRPGRYWYRAAPTRWLELFDAMRSASRTPRLVERYLPGRGSPPEDLVVLLAGDDPSGFVHAPARFVAYLGFDWLDRFGRDEP